MKIPLASGNEGNYTKKSYFMKSCIIITGMQSDELTL